MKTHDDTLILTREEKIDSCLISDKLDKKFFYKFVGICVPIFVFIFVIFGTFLNWNLW